MSDVAAIIKVMPQSPDVDLDALEDKLSAVLPDGASIQDFTREDIAFGLVALIATVVVPDAEGGTEVVEEAFGGVGTVESVEVQNVTRL